MGKNDKKGGDKGGSKAKGGDKESGGKAKGGQVVNVRHILVRTSSAPQFFWMLTTDASVRNIAKRKRH